MPSPQKICPHCHTPAPVSAGFCGSCGHQYRTQFAGSGARSSSLSPLLFVLVPLFAVGAFWLVLTLGRKPTPSIDTAKTTPLPLEPPRAIEESHTEPSAPKTESDPLIREAQRALKHANQEIEDRALHLKEEEQRSRSSRGSSRKIESDPIILEGGR